MMERLLFQVVEEPLASQLHAQEPLRRVGTVDEAECQPQSASVEVPSEVEGVDDPLEFGEPVVHLLSPQV